MNIYIYIQYVSIQIRVTLARQVDVIGAKVHCNFVAIDGSSHSQDVFSIFCFPIYNIYNIYNAITIYFFIRFSKISNLEMSTVLSKTASKTKPPKP